MMDFGLQMMDFGDSARGTSSGRAFHTRSKTDDFVLVLKNDEFVLKEYGFLLKQVREMPVGAALYRHGRLRRAIAGCAAPP